LCNWRWNVRSEARPFWSQPVNTAVCELAEFNIASRKWHMSTLHTTFRWYCFVLLVLVPKTLPQIRS
jgi:hypothetical protein